MILGTQWYLLFNIIAGTSTIPTELRYAARNLGLGGWLKWRRYLLPEVFPSFVTGAITATGGFCVEKIAQSLLKIIQQPCIVKKCDSVIRLSITSSMGISMYPQDGETADNLIKSADKAMYKSKKTKSGYSFAV